MRAFDFWEVPWGGGRMVANAAATVVDGYSMNRSEQARIDSSFLCGENQQKEGETA